MPTLYWGAYPIFLSDISLDTTRNRHRRPEPSIPHGDRHDRRGTQVFPKGEENYAAQRKVPIEDPLDAINKVNVPSRYDPVFDACVRSPKIVDIVADLMGAEH